jgi:hypothetical protein
MSIDARCRKHCSIVVRDLDDAWPFCPALGETVVTSPFELGLSAILPPDSTQDTRSDRAA